MINFEKTLKNHIKVVGSFIAKMDAYLEKEKELPKHIGKNLANALNELDKTNDAIRYFSLGVDFRKDNKEKFFKDCLRGDKG